MAGVALLHSVPEEGAFLLEALRVSGHRVDLVDDPASAEGVLGADVILTDLDSAIAAGWVRPADGGKPPRLPLIVASPHDAFLAVVRSTVAATLSMPATREEIDDAIRRAITRERDPPRPSKEPRDPAIRDAELARRGMSSDRVDPEFLGIAALIARSVDAPIALITVVDSRRQVFVGHVGLPVDLATEGATTRSWSFCQPGMASGSPMTVADAQLHPLFANNPLVETKLVRSYAGAPIEIQGLGMVGTVCVLSPTPRVFTARDLATLQIAAKLAAARLERRGPVFHGQRPTRCEEDSSLHVGDLIGDQYWITASLGRGGQSEVFLARDRLSGQMVAIKTLHTLDEMALVREAEALTRLRHPNIVQLHGWGRGPALYLVLEYVEGPTLAEHIDGARRENRPLPLPEVADTVRQLAGALASMHALGYVHGDVKPSNVIFDRALDRAVLIDFGFPLAVGTPSAAEEREGSSPIVGGTPGSSAPEQFVASSVPTIASPALDVYALATVAYAMIAGEGPFSGVRRRDRIAAQLTETFTPASSMRRGLPYAIDDFFARALAADPGQRSSSVLELADELEQLVACSQPVVRAPEPGNGLREPRSRGIAFRTYRREVRRRDGDEREAAFFAKLSPEDRAVFDSVDDDAVYYSAAPLITYLGVYADGDDDRLTALGYDLAALALPDALRSMRVNRTPETLLYAAGPLLHRFHGWGRVEIERPARGLARVTLHLPAGFAKVTCSYFIGIERALLAMAGRACTVERDLSCKQAEDVCVFTVSWAAHYRAEPFTTRMGHQGVAVAPPLLDVGGRPRA